MGDTASIPANNGLNVGGLANEAAQTKSNQSPVKGDMWKFGSSNWRVENGVTRPANPEEIVAEVKSSPAAIVQMLNTGTNLLRFDANGHYEERASAIAALQKQNNKTPEQIAAEVENATNQLRAQMKADIENGVFTVDDAGRVYFHGANGAEQPGVQVPPERIGLEMNTKLIEALSDRISALTALKSKLQPIDEWVQNNEEGGHAILTFRTQQRVYYQERDYDLVGSPWFGDQWTRSDAKMNSEPDATWRNTVKRLSDFEKEFDTRNGERYITQIREEYEDLMQGSGITLASWPESLNNTAPENYLSFADRPYLSHKIHAGFAERHYQSVRQTRETERLALGINDIEEAQQNVNSRISTLSNLSEQLGTNFQVDNNRFNSIIEAMNNYNKSVVDSLRRYSVI